MEARTEPEPRVHRRSWRKSIYARAALFLLLGSGTIVGAVAALSVALVEESVERILRERLGLARTAGILLERRIHADLLHVAQEVAPILGRDPGAGASAELRSALAHECARTIFGEGAFVLDRDARLLVDFPEESSALAQAFDLAGLARDSAASRRPVASPLQTLSAGPRRALVIVAPVTARDGRPLGWVGGVLQPAATNVLEGLLPSSPEDSTAIDLVDGHGVVVASTARGAIFGVGDHGSVLNEAIRERRDLRGRCHSCHDQAPRPSTEVMAFAPLPSLALGLAVHQPERDALAPAFSLRKRLYVLGFGFAVLFVGFAGLSVRSVVDPVTRLTTAVRGLGSAGGPLSLPPFGEDEIGELARALVHWRGRTIESLADAERHRRALSEEVELRGRAARRQMLQQLLVRSVLKAQEDERRRIARELHDTLAQDLAALRLELERVAGQAGTRAVKDKLAELEDRTRTMLASVRSLLLDLRPSVAESAGFLPAVTWALERLEREHGVAGFLTVKGEEVALHPEDAVTAFRVVQEALQNAVEHGAASRVFVTVAFEAGQVALTIEDDGRGFDVAAVRSRGPDPESGHGLGLLGMEERARIIGGTMEIESRPDDGTTVRVVFPAPAPAARAGA